MRILITGDSWSQGEWNGPKTTHKGIEQYLLDDGYDVVNVGQGGYNNIQAFDAIKKDFDHLIFFWSDPLRQATWGELNNKTPLQIIEKHTDYYMEQLDSFPLVTLIGGCAKVKYYNYIPNIKYVIPSMSETIVPEFEDSPYMASHEWENIWQNLKNPTTQWKQEILEISDLTDRKYNLWQERKDYFWPDGLHANRKGARIVYDHMLNLWSTS